MSKSPQHNVKVKNRPISNHEAERYGLDLVSTHFKDVIHYEYEDSENGINYNVTLDEDGNIEIEAEDPLRYFANSPHPDFTYKGHIRDLEKKGYDQNSTWKPFYQFIEEINRTLEENEDDNILDIFLAQIQRTTVAWESQDGEEPSPYR